MANLGTQQLIENSGIYQSFAGCDLRAMFTMKNAAGDWVQKQVGTLSSISYTCVREVSPQYATGDPNYKSISKGKRSISGTMTFIVFDRDPLIREVVGTSNEGLGDLGTQFLIDAAYRTNLRDSATAIRSIASSDTYGGANIDFLAAAASAVQKLRNMLKAEKLNFADQLAPFDVTNTFINDQGAASFSAIRQITIVSQGGGHSMHDTENDMAYSYVARFYEPLAPMIDGGQETRYLNDADTLPTRQV